MKIKQVIALISTSLLLLCGCQNTDHQQKLTYTDVLFDTVINVQILDDVDEDILAGCEQICKKYDIMFSRTNPESEISKINNSAGTAVTVSEDTISIIKKGIYYSQLSDGAFDITIGSVSSLWDFKSEDHIVPPETSIESAVQNVDYTHIEIVDNTVKLSYPNMKIDVGALAKGYIADRLKEHLINNGVEHAIIDLGGNVLVIGTKPDGSDYNIGIQKPFDETGVPYTSVKISDKSMVTTGIYQRYFEKDGNFYHHILDPETGYPCQNNLYSVTIVTDSSADADALSTTTFLLGYDKGMDFINSLDNVEAIFITDDMEIHYSNNL